MKKLASRVFFVGTILFAMLPAILPMTARAQQTLGAINGTVTDTSNAVVPQAKIEAKNLGTGLTVTATTQNDGSYNMVDLPIGAYSVTISKQGFKTEVHSNILVRGNLATTVNATLQTGEVSTTVTVTGTPLLNQTDTTNGYTLGTEVIQNTPLGTGSFTQLAILAPGVSADMLNGSGTNAGLGNQDIFANGQRDTSNSFTLNSVNANNVFNGKSSSQVADNRFVLSTGEHFLGGNGEDIQTSTSVYNAIGEGLPTPPQETIQEIHVNTSMYDASQGANSGAHVEVQTKSGTNNYHGQVWEYHQTSAWNAAPFFRNADTSIPASDKVPPLHYNRFGGEYGGPIIHNKLFFYGSYQGIRVTDDLDAASTLSVPVGLTNDRSDAGLIAAANSFIDPGGTCGTTGQPACFSGTIDPVARNLLNAKLPDGSFLIPSAQIPLAQITQGHDVTLQGPAATFNADQLNANMDYDFSAKDRFSGKYYYQRNPTTSPFAISATLGFPQSLRAGSQVVSLDNTTVLSPNLTWEQRSGFIREIAFATTSQPFGPSTPGINVFGNPKFPGIFIENPDNVTFNGLGIGPAADQATFSNAGVFQNQWEQASDVTWQLGRHSITTGIVWDHNQLNIVNHNNQLAKLEFRNFTDFLTGNLRIDTPEHTVLFNGASNRYFKSNQMGTYVQDVFKVRPNLSVDLGLRWDWDGALSEKNGFLTNFYPQDYNFDLASDTITNIGLVVAGDNKAFGTKGVSDSTLTGRQWGFAPRIGIVWSPAAVKNFVVRAGFGLYNDRGEFFTEFSPSAGFGFNGPFGVTLEPPFIVPFLGQCTTSGCLANPFGTTPPPPPPSNLSSVAALIPNLAGLSGCAEPVTVGCTPVNGTTQPFLFGGYDPRNVLPYSENWQLDLQWQPWNTVAMTLAYVGNRGLHETIPVPFNQPLVATATNAVNGQTVSYGYQAVDTSAATCPTENPSLPFTTPCPLQTEQVNTSTGGNTDLRTPFPGYSPNSVFYEAEGISHYNALEFNVNKRLSAGLQVTGSYTWSHSLDEQSGLGLFYNGNNPLDPRSGYASSDFDRTHVFTVAYDYSLPQFKAAGSMLSKWVNGWGLGGITVLESGEPYNVYDFSGSVGGLFYSANDFITNPILPVASGFNAKTAQLQGTTGINAANPILNVNAFGIPTPFAPGTNGVPACGQAVNPNTGAPDGTTVCDTFETGFGTTGRNIFRGPFQTRFDFGVYKETKLTERFSLRYDAQFFNIFNHPSFDTPNNNVTLNPCFNPTPCYTVPAPASQNLGILQHTIGSPRFIQMALHLTF